MIKRLMHNWKAGVSCFQETKLQGDIKDITKDLWSNSWVKCATRSKWHKRGHYLHVYNLQICGQNTRF